jgi:hypothetical protein
LHDESNFFILWSLKSVILDICVAVFDFFCLLKPHFFYDGSNFFIRWPIASIILHIFPGRKIRLVETGLVPNQVAIDWNVCEEFLRRMGRADPSAARPHGPLDARTMRAMDCGRRTCQSVIPAAKNGIPRRNDALITLSDFTISMRLDRIATETDHA